jgi:uncharacterized protein YggU (UPF0235/DUF167 family)
VLRLTVQAHPGSRHEGLELLEDGSLSVHVRARPVDGQANAAIEQAIANALRLRPRQVRLVSGQHSRRKILEVDLPDVAALHQRLVAHAVRSS